MRYFMLLSYLGAPFHGWQRQPNAVSVQQVLEEALAKVFRRHVPVTGAGRTDSGVNARRMWIHFDAEEHESVCPKRLVTSLNRLCGKEIAILGIRIAKPDAHARFDAVRRTYKYFVSFRKTPFMYPLEWVSPSALDIDRMNEAADILLSTSDFTSFAKLHADTKTNICEVSHARWTPYEDFTGNSGIVFTISADRFLRNMVRAVVGTLVDVGRGKLSHEGFRKIISQRDRCAAGTSMPAEALFLWDVEYPEEIFLSGLLPQPD